MQHPMWQRITFGVVLTIVILWLWSHYGGRKVTQVGAKQ